MASTHTLLHLFKQNFKFSSAHFLIFDDHSAEKLHGHNYQVKVDIECPPEDEWTHQGYFIDFTVFKKKIKELVDAWDEHVLLPALHKDIKTSEKGDSLELKFRDRFYVFPKNEVILLPVVNTSVEQLSKLLAEALMKEFAQSGLRSIEVTVEETSGQSARTRIAVS